MGLFAFAWIKGDVIKVLTSMEQPSSDPLSMALLMML